MQKNIRLKQFGVVLVALISLFILNACEEQKTAENQGVQTTTAPSAPVAEEAVRSSVTPPPPSEDVLQLQNSEGVFYEIFVRAFQDSDGDGIGDLKGVTQRLDYLNDGDPSTTSDLGVTGIWLMPILKSPSYHGYDVTDYYEINPQYGTKADLRELIDEAHKRGIKVIMDMVFNHSSNQHPWFKDAIKEKNSPYHKYYVWAEEEGLDAGRMGPFGLPAFYGRDDKHYMAIFWQGMPDLNMKNQQVRDEIVKVGQYWLNFGLDGYRLDAAKHVFEDFPEDKTDPKIHELNRDWWQEFRRGMDQVKPGAYLVGEVWDSPVVVAPHLDQALTSAFNFELSRQILSTVKAETASPLQSLLQRMYNLFRTASQGQFSDSTFITNHDMDRVRSQLFGDMERSKMAGAIMLTLPGTPYIYYGEEIGMLGKKPDEYIREPMLWYKDGGDGPGKTKWEASRDNTEDPVSVEEQDSDPKSILNVYRKLIQTRMAEPALQYGAYLDYRFENRNVLAYIRKTNDDQVLVLHNLSFKEQTVTLSDPMFTKVIASTAEGSKVNAQEVTLAPYSTVFMK